MKIHNARLGFANNSSSSHSIVFLKDQNDDLRQVDGGDTYGYSYGWGAFTLASAEEKIKYLHAIIQHNLRKSIGEEAAAKIAEGLTGQSPPTNSEGKLLLHEIDHQSIWVLPHNWEETGLDIQFFNDFKSHLLRDDVVILGGNDNDGEHPLTDVATATPANELPTEWGLHRLVARKDDNYYILFNRDSGAKLRISFDNIPAPEKAPVPELVDLKITDYCPFDCKMCYQGSTKDGEHASEETIHSILEMLAEWKVFEVAIGGGEPTLHPDFLFILKKAHELKIVPNFTTKNIKWIEDNYPIISELIGSFAYSVESAEDVKRLSGVLEKYDVNNYKYPTIGYSVNNIATCQYIIGIDSDPKTLSDILIAARKRNLPVTLLGYKTTGRGLAFGEEKGVKWIDIIKSLAKDHQLPLLLIDTVLADKYYDELIAAGVPKYLLTRKDGKFSAYIDAVNQTIHPSSYHEDNGTKLATVSDLLAFDSKANRDIFARF